jgi:hypothetical protein
MFCSVGTRAGSKSGMPSFSPLAVSSRRRERKAQLPRKCSMQRKSSTNPQARANPIAILYRTCFTLRIAHFEHLTASALRHRGHHAVSNMSEFQAIINSINVWNWRKLALGVEFQHRQGRDRSVQPRCGKREWNFMVPLYILLVFFFILVIFLRPTAESAAPFNARDRKNEQNDGSEVMAPVLMDNSTSTVVQGN